MNTFQITPFLWCSFLLLLFSCQPEEIFSPKAIKAALLHPIEYTTAPFDWGKEKMQFDFTADNKYGAHKRNTFDMVLATNDSTPKPLVVYIHGGGFNRGEKENAYIHSDTIKRFVQEGISFATINYRYLSQTENGVLDCLNDCKRFVQYIRHHADAFNVDANRIACYGPSAGGGAGLWLATHREMKDLTHPDPVEWESTRIQAVVALGAQATYDLTKWEDIFSEFDFQLDDGTYDPISLFNFYAIENFGQLYQRKMRRYRKTVDMLHLISDDDPAIYMFNTGKPLPPDDLGSLYHHPYHAQAVLEAASQKKLRHMITAPGLDIVPEDFVGPVDFLKQELLK